jgi:hypothetical protein
VAIATVSQAIASQHEFLRPNLEELALLSGTLWKRIGARTDIKAVSNRPARVPFQPLTGGIFRTGVNLFDGADMGIGSGPVETFGILSCASFLQASEYTALTEYSTDSDEKAIENYVTLTQKQAAETFAGYMDAVVQGDGSNTLDTVVAIAGLGITVTNANFFQDNQFLDWWSALGGTFRGTVQIQSVDIANNTIWLTTAAPAGAVNGDLLLVTGSAGVANSGLFGLRYYHVAGNAGNYMGVQRSAFPGKFSTPNINFGATGGSLTPASVRALEAQIILALGEEAAEEASIIAHMNVDMAAAWENNALPVQSIIYNELKGDRSEDMLKRRIPNTIAGREIVRNVRAKPGIIDFIPLKHYFRIETKAVDYYEVGGQTIFPAYGASGGLQSSLLCYLVTMVQVGLGQPRRAGFMNNVNIPHLYFGH